MMKFGLLKHWNVISTIGAVASSIVLSVVGVPVLIGIPAAVVAGVGISYVFEKFGIDPYFFNKSSKEETKVEDVPEQKVVKSELQEAFEKLEKTVATYNTKSSHARFVVSDKIYSGLQDLLLTIEGFINKTGANVISRADYQIQETYSFSSNPYNSISDGSGWEGVAKDLRQLSTILSNDYLGKILATPELVDVPEEKINDIVASAKVVIQNIEEKNKDVIRYETVIGAHNVNSLLEQKEFEGVFNNLDKKDSKTA